MAKNKKTVLLTGASRGIGKAIFSVLSNNDDYRVLAPTRKELDLLDEESIVSFFRLFPEVDILINNAGINIILPVDKIDNISMENMLNTNLVAPLKLISHVFPYMKINKFGRIINISSIWGIRSKEFRTLYSMTKFGINGVTRSLSRELGPFNILVNSICPGYVNTEMTQKNVSQEEQEEIKKTIPLGRFADPVEIAKLVRFLISEDNSYITGQCIIIDGGFLS